MEAKFSSDEITITLSKDELNVFVLHANSAAIYYEQKNLTALADEAREHARKIYNILYDIGYYD